MNQNISIISIGNELLNGKIQNTNTHTIARFLTARGFHIIDSLVIPDDDTALFKALDYCNSSHSIIITGGLGPTPDDQTRDFIAAYFSKELLMNTEAELHVQKVLSGYKLKASADQLRQALFPTGAHPLKNPFGSAMGFHLEDGQQQIFVTPGVPYEMFPMLENEIYPILSKQHQTDIYSREILSLNIGEGNQTRILKELTLPEGAIFSSLPELDGLRLSITMSGTFSEIKPQVDQAIESILNIFNEHGFEDEIISTDGSPLIDTLQKICIKNNSTVSTVESCTGGGIGSLLTALPGSSAYYTGGWVTYSNTMKEEQVAVPSATISQHGAVSQEVVEAMALNGKKRSQSDYSIAVSGIAGPDGGTAEKPVGLVWMAIAHPDGVDSFHKNFKGDRNSLRTKVSFYLINELRKKIISYTNKHLHT